MYSSSSSSSQQSAANNININNNDLMRFDSAPSSFLSTAVDSVAGISHHHQHHRPQHQHQHQSLNAPPESTHSKLSSGGGESKSTLTLLTSYAGLTEPTSSSSTSNLIRHSSSPAGFLNHLTSDIGFCASKGYQENYKQPIRLGSQLSFTKQDHHHHNNSLTQISEVNECVIEAGINNERKRSSSTSQSRSTSGFSLTAWNNDDNCNNGFVFSAPSTKRTANKNNIDDDILNGLASIDPEYGLPMDALEIATMERLSQFPQDSVPCKIRAKRGCATHPRSIAERERRTRISGKLKMLQELVPNMDKQTSYADMLDLAVEHIKGLQSQIEKLNKDMDHCTCGCKQNKHC